MKLLEDKIKACGKILPGDVLKVDSFLNHQLDVVFLDQLAEELYRRYRDAGVNKILTIEASGIGIASLVALKFRCPLVFAKKSKTSNLGADVFSAQVHSYTHGNDNTIVVSKQYLRETDTLLLIDDFLAMGEALSGLLEVAAQAGAKVAGAGIIIEKAYQQGGALIRARGVRVESLARVAYMTDAGEIGFCED